MEEIYDMHCHLDFATGALNIAKESHDQAIEALCSTVMPSSYVSARAKFEDCPNIRVSLGMHPWWIAEGRVGEADIARFTELQQDAAFIGEIGLDFSGRNRQSAERQVEIFAKLLEPIVASGASKVVTIHAVRSADRVMDELERFDPSGSNRFLFHWFSGSHEEFGRAVSKGYYFSVGMKMLATENGRTYAQAIPIERLLLESDSPAHEGDDWDAATWRQEMDNTLSDLAKLRGMEVQELLGYIGKNSLDLLS